MLFYEINITKVLQVAKSTNSRVVSSGWIGDWTQTNDLKQEVYWNTLPNMDHGVLGVRNPSMREEGDQWVISFDAAKHDYSVHSEIAETRYYYQYPIGGTELTFIKKEPIPLVPEDMVKCQLNMGMIINAKKAWTALNDKQPGDPVDTNQLFSVFLKGHDIKCPDGGVYDVGPVEEMPKCSIHGVYKQ